MFNAPALDTTQLLPCLPGFAALAYDLDHILRRILDAVVFSEGIDCDGEAP